MTRFSLRFVLSCIACLQLLVVVWTGNGHAQTTAPPGRVIKHLPIYSTQSGSHQRANLIINTAEEFQRVFDVIVRDFPARPPLPEVDFSQNMVVAILLGDQLALRRFVNIAQVIETGGAQPEIIVEFTIASGRTTDRDGIRVTAPTQPSYFYQIPKSNLPVSFFNVGAQDLGRNDVEAFKDPLGGDASGNVTGVFSELAVAGREAVHADREAIVKGQEEGLRFLASAVGQNRVALNITLVLVSACFGWLMHIGFMLLQTGLTRRGNAVNSMATYLIVLLAAVAGYWVCGWALMWGAHGPIARLGGIGPITDTQARLTVPGLGSLAALKGFFLAGNFYDIGAGVLFLLQAALAGLAVVIPLGAWLERMKVPVLAMWGFFAAALIYPVFGHWSWGQGWLAELGAQGLGVGFVDFAGSGAIHAFAGIAAFTGLCLLGRRRAMDEKVEFAATPHNLLMVGQGALIIGVCWLGLALGALQGVSGAGGLRVGLVATTLLLAGTGGALAAVCFSRLLFRRCKIQMLWGGLLAGMVAVSGGAAFVSPSVAFFIGAAGGVLSVFAAQYLQSRALDDPANVVGIHGVAGVWGMLAVGVFADGTFGAGWNDTVINRQPVPLVGVLSGSVAQLGAQLIGIVALVCWTAATSWLFLTVAKKVFTTLRADEGIDPETLDAMLWGIETAPVQGGGSTLACVLPDAPAQHGTVPGFDPFSEPPLVTK